MQMKNSVHLQTYDWQRSTQQAKGAIVRSHAIKHKMGHLTRRPLPYWVVRGWHVLWNGAMMVSMCCCSDVNNTSWRSAFVIPSSGINSRARARKWLNVFFFTTYRNWPTLKWPTLIINMWRTCWRAGRTFDLFPVRLFRPVNCNGWKVMIALDDGDGRMVDSVHRNEAALKSYFIGDGHVAWHPRNTKLSCTY